MSAILFRSAQRGDGSVLAALVGESDCPEFWEPADRYRWAANFLSEMEKAGSLLCVNSLAAREQLANVLDATFRGAYDLGHGDRT